MKRILMIDNYDSFTYNLVQYLGELGALVIVWRNDCFALQDVADLDPDGIVVSPGPCTPKEAGLSVPLIQRYAPRYPILGVCLGHQSIGEAFGAAVRRHRVIVHGKTSPILHDGSGVFAGLPTPLTATRYHSLVVEDLPDELEVNAWCDEAGGRTVMGLRHRRYPTHGVQFHPESVLTEGGRQMLANFLQMCE
ncbi:anthranilate synthase component II [Meiothermus taiwanensis]|jgi:anthranilate synthase component 2|uniref:Anthranilate synthase component II n=1 Tax=Meiothermus taiwanensis WR-220 TaxID=1339250 RepID=A0ABM6WEP1_9DEIN|nr:aminodeoxychorismate/anthranilate synthase component II [Meiothermus taiwanensis]AWR85420.1 anthranilate synthase component II [Meiothermus taiwanensis WR-220]KIQ54001.1 anthranilate synthase [Meiothermus taiwanensis]KZK15144.1 anthranilate synthase component 2 [Meiothermus taiwanensis]